MPRMYRKGDVAELDVPALAWVGPDMRGSPRAGFCGLAVPSRQPRAPALHRAHRYGAGARIACPGKGRELP